MITDTDTRVNIASIVRDIGVYAFGILESGVDVILLVKDSHQQPPIRL